MGEYIFRGYNAAVFISAPKPERRLRADNTRADSPSSLRLCSNVDPMITLRTVFHSYCHFIEKDNRLLEII